MHLVVQEMVDALGYAAAEEAYNSHRSFMAGRFAGIFGYGVESGLYFNALNHGKAGAVTLLFALKTTRTQGDAPADASSVRWRACLTRSMTPNRTSSFRRNGRR